MALTKVSGDFIQDGSITQGHLHSSHGITTSDIGEGSNLYFTTARVNTAVGNLSTSDLSEGTNLYYTNARADARIALQVGSNLDLSSKSTSDLSEGTNLYYTQARFNTAFAAKSTSDLSEGTNLYYTDARVGSYLTTNSYATQSYVNTQVSNLVDSAPSTLDTLNELAAALGDDANFSTTVTNSIATKLPLAGGTLTGALQAQSWLFRSMANQTEYHVLDNGSLNGPSWKFRYDGATANRYVDFGYKDGNGTYYAGLKLYNNQTISWRGTDIINSTAQWVGGIASSGYNNSNWDTAYGWGDHASAGYLTSFDITTQTDPKYLRSNATDTATGALTLSSTDNHYNGHFYWDAYNADGAHYPHFLDGSNANGVDINWRLYTGSNVGVNHLWNITKTEFRNQLHTTVDVRAPIYYDRNNTGYYVDPASSSKLVYLGLATDPNTSGGYRLNMGGSIDMNNNSIDYLQQIHFNDNVRFYDDGNDSYLNYVSGDSNTTGIKFYSNAGNSFRGYVYGDSGGFGLLDSDGNWSVRIPLGGSGLELRSNNNVEFTVNDDHTLSHGSSRAPIFYDSDDTTYLLNPSAGQMRLATTNNFSAIETRGSGGYLSFRVTDGSHSDGWGWSFTNNDISSTSWTTYLRVNYSGTATSSNVVAAGSFNAPIFYDSNDTGYYINPNGQSKIRNNNAQEALIIEGDYPQLTIRRTSVADASIHYDAGFSKKFNVGPGAGAAEEDEFGFAIYDGPRGTHYGTPFRISADTGYVQVGDKDHPAYPLDILGTAYSSSDFRAPVFYDSNNTAYHVDPNGTSDIHDINMHSATATHFGIANSSTSTRDGISLYGGATGGEPTYGLLFTGTSGFGTHGGVTSDWATYFTMNNNTSRGWIFRRVGSGNSASISAGGLATFDDSVRTPIFYDSNDTNYYMDPNSTSVIKDITISGKLQNNPGEGYWRHTSTYQYISPTVYYYYIKVAKIASGTSIGAFEYYNKRDSNFPGATRGTVHLASYNSGSMSVQHDSEGGDGQVEAQVWIDNNRDVYMRFSGSAWNSFFRWRWIYNSGITEYDGSSKTTSQPSNSAEIGKGESKRFAWGNASSVTEYSSFFVHKKISSYERVDAPIFYDYDDTNYYVNPNSTSRIKKTDLIASGSGWDDGLNLYSNDASNRWNLLVDDGAGDMFRIAYNNSEKFRLQTDGEVFTLGTGKAGSDYRAPVFYDSNNTTYFLHPDSTGTSLHIAGSVEADTYYKPGLLLNASGTGSGGAALGMQQITSEGWTGIFVDFEPYTGWGLYHDNPNNYFCVTSESSTNGIRSFTVPSRSSGSRTAYEKIRFDQNGGDIQSGGSIYASTFYERTNTGYYIDPAGGSKISHLGINMDPETGSAGVHLKVQGGTNGIRGAELYSGTYSQALYVEAPQYGQCAQWNYAYVSGNLNTQILHSFMFAGTAKGSISVTSTSTSFNTTSDYRLKENLVDINDGITRVKQLQPKRFNFIGDTQIVDGFVAHEAQSVVPEAVTGTQDEVDHNNEPVYQGIDQAKLVPLLTAALKEAIQKIEDLETRVQTLENQ